MISFPSLFVVFTKLLEEFIVEGRRREGEGGREGKGREGGGKVFTGEGKRKENY